MDRREFLKSTAATAVLVAATAKLPAQVLAPDAEKKTGAKDLPDVVAVRNGEPVGMFRKGIDALGGMAAFVKPGQSVVVKPNIGWDRVPELAANTNPGLVAEIVRQCLAAGASKVEVFDHTCHEWRSCYKNSGIKEAVEKAGGTVLPGNDSSWYVERECPGAVKMKKAKIHKSIVESDVFINVPILKHHGGAKMTAIMKNFMGIVDDRRFMHNNNLPQCIADSVLYRRPDLNVLDAYRIMVTNGPQGVNANDVQTPKYLLLSRDMVALDAMGAKLLKFKLSEVPYIAIAEKMGIGTSDESKLKILRLDA